MKFKHYRILLLLCCLFVSRFVGYSQKSFHLTITLPKKVDTSKLQFYFDDGILIKKINYKSDSKGRLIFSGNYFGLYAVLEMQYSDSKIRYEQQFFMKDRPANIIFHTLSNTNDSITNYTMQNIRNFNEERIKMFIADSAEIQLAREYEKLNLEKINSGNYPDITKYYFNVILKNIRIKKLDYILSHTDSYFSFYTFRTEIARRPIVKPDSLLSILNKQFPDSFRNSDEGNILKDFIVSNIPKTNQDFALDFFAKNIRNQNVTLTQFRGKNYVLLHFWATWCSPCVKELPLIAKIDSMYKKFGLRIISIASKSLHPKDYPATIKKYKMNWTNIYNDTKLDLRYGGYPVPRLVLIDKSGHIIYDTQSIGNKDDLSLNQLMQILKDNLK